MLGRLFRRSLIFLSPVPKPIFRLVPYHPIRLFAKKKGKGSKGGEDHSESVENTFDLDETKKQMGEAVEKLTERMGKLKLGRVDPRVIDDIWVSEKQAKLKDLAQIIPRSNSEYVVKLFDPKNIDSALSAIATGSAHLTGRKDSVSSLLVTVPKANNEIKDEMLKEAKNMSEQTKNTIRKYRLNAIQEVKKIKSVGEDENKRMQKQVQTTSEQFCTKVDQMLKEKEQTLNNG